MASAQLHRDGAEFLERWSAYVDHFLAARSVLSSALFPEKPAQMAFGYQYARPVLEDVTSWLAERHDPQDFGSAQARPRAHANGLYLASGVWTYSVSALSAVLEKERLDPVRVVSTLEFFIRAYKSYVEPTGWEEILTPDLDTENRVLPAEQVAEVEAHLQPIGDLKLQRIAGALANYSWLLECESRQGVFVHGLYPTADGGKLLIREFGDLSGSFYPWVDSELIGLRPGPIAIAFELPSSFSAAFDAFGVGRFQPEDYGDLVTRVAVIDAAGYAKDPIGWLRELEPRLVAAHRALFRTVAGWGPRERFIGGVTSYARMWAELVRAGGGGESEAQRLVYEPLRAVLGEPLDRRLNQLDQEIPLWTWVGMQDRPTTFEPLIEMLSVGEKSVDA